MSKKNKTNLIYKKSESRRRALTGRETTDAKDIATRCRIRVIEIEEERKKRYAKQSELDQEPVSVFSQQI